jgi:ESCRT-II complex subunit VPS22
VLRAVELSSRVGWSSQRCERVLAELLKEGLAMIDDGAPDKVRLYWFPALTPHQQQ